MGATAHMFLPVFDSLQVATSYHYLQLRFSNAKHRLETRFW